jgi:hypothetical protein
VILITGGIQGAVSCINHLRSPIPLINQDLQSLISISSCSIIFCDDAITTKDEGIILSVGKWSTVIWFGHVR